MTDEPIVEPATSAAKLAAQYAGFRCDGIDRRDQEIVAGDSSAREKQAVRSKS